MLFNQEFPTTAVICQTCMYSLRKMYDGYNELRTRTKAIPDTFLIFNFPTSSPVEEKQQPVPGPAITQALPLFTPVASTPSKPSTEPIQSTPLHKKMMKAHQSARNVTRLTFRSTTRGIMNQEMLNFASGSKLLKRIDYGSLEAMEIETLNELRILAPTLEYVLAGLSIKKSTGTFVLHPAMLTVVSIFLSLLKKKTTAFQRLIGIILWRTKASIQVRLKLLLEIKFS